MATVSLDEYSSLETHPLVTAGKRSLLPFDSHRMRLWKYPRLLRLLFCLAVCQVVVPSLVAVADAWRIDQRQAYAHIESESGAGCVLVHHDNCALCAFLTGCSSLPLAPNQPWPRGVAVVTPSPNASERPPGGAYLHPSQRAPPQS